LYYTASGIITLCRWPSGAQVERGGGGLLTACEQDPAPKLSANLYDIYHCCVYSEKLQMMDRGNVRNMKSFIPKINLRI